MKKRNLILDFTSLLDVIMILLFIVMSKQGEVAASAVEEYQQLQNDFAAAEAQISELQNEIAELSDVIDVHNEIENSYQVYTSEAVIVTIDNAIEDDQHILRLWKNDDEDNAKILFMRDNNENHTKESIENYVLSLVAENTDEFKHPIYVVFHKDKSAIYKQESDNIEGVLKKLQRENSEVFYKIIEAR